MTTPFFELSFIPFPYFTQKITLVYRIGKYFSNYISFSKTIWKW